MIYKLFVDEKVKIWKRSYINVEADNINDAVKKCLNQYQNSENQEILYDTEEGLNPIDENLPTLEVYVNDNSRYNPIYTNDPLKVNK